MLLITRLFVTSSVIAMLILTVLKAANSHLMINPNDSSIVWRSRDGDTRQHKRNSRSQQMANTHLTRHSVFHFVLRVSGRRWRWWCDLFPLFLRQRKHLATVVHIHAWNPHQEFGIFVAKSPQLIQENIKPQSFGRGAHGHISWGPMWDLLRGTRNRTNSR